mmetsp:Transcript_2467/g.5386  ORF Transcript_2467/g.5386 Transcript_2467/m.5386 type:complete len:99 (+) Transcript_2467:4822-5118(+)
MARWFLKDSFVDVVSGKIRDTCVLVGEYDDAHDRNVPKVDTTAVLLAKRLHGDLSKTVMKSKCGTLLWTATFLGFFLSIFRRGLVHTSFIPTTNTIQR